MEPVEALQLLDRARVVVDAQVDEDVRERRVAAVPLDDEERGGLLSAPVAACRLRGREAGEQPLGERRAGAVASNVSASASTVSAETRMFPCAA